MTPKETENIPKIPSIIDDIDLNELIKTTNLNIIEKYNLIPTDDLTTARRVVIKSLPKPVFVKKIKNTEFNKYLLFMTISDNGKLYSINVDAISTRRSLIACAIKTSNIANKDDIDLSVLIDKMVGIKRTSFKDSYGIHTPLNFYILSE